MSSLILVQLFQKKIFTIFAQYFQLYNWNYNNIIFQRLLLFIIIWCDCIFYAKNIQCMLQCKIKRITFNHVLKLWEELDFKGSPKLSQIAQAKLPHLLKPLAPSWMLLDACPVCEHSFKHSVYIHHYVLNLVNFKGSGRGIF